MSVPANVKPSDLHEDDLAMEIEDEYDPMIPNSYELVLKERRAEREKEREEEVLINYSYMHIHTPGGVVISMHIHIRLHQTELVLSFPHSLNVHACCHFWKLIVVCFEILYPCVES